MKQNRAIFVVHPISFNLYEIEVETLAGTPMKCTNLETDRSKLKIFAYLPPTGFAAAITEQRA